MRLDKPVQLLELARAIEATGAEGMTIEGMAAKLRVDYRTAQRYRDALRRLFPHMEEQQRENRLYHSLRPGVDRLFNVPTTDELAELAMARLGLENTGADGRAALLRSLAGKVAAMVPGRNWTTIAPDLEALVAAEGYAVQAGPRPVDNSETLATIREALKACEALSLCYKSASNPEGRRRRVSPWGLLYGRAYYLIGPEDGWDKPVPWRLDRISDVRRDGARTDPPADWTIIDYAADSFGIFHEPPSDIALRFLPAAAPTADRFLFHPRQTKEWQADGSLVVRFTAGGLLELSRHLFTWGTTVEILAPDGLRDLLRTTLAEALAHHQATPPPADPQQAAMSPPPAPR
ncbi:helix-turn-helix transcriptional regulator [Acidisphaera rubrifaciens]|uniref:Uncharacterized protein n=1 Tax=Acidisphaera rubrifaciens HS-AP3 TaxID=1231350 RepID=A0A0D6P9V1_9PROT|nr:WYL domain-containing protein [Acidisphaera rubrifaciens]GAN77983.1 hypothetical protein Asru_0550_03 [Acidisphaera rubrifaciens HS-AP3]